MLPLTMAEMFLIAGGALGIFAHVSFVVVVKWHFAYQKMVVKWHFANQKTGQDITQNAISK